MARMGEHIMWGRLVRVLMITTVGMCGTTQTAMAQDAADVHTFTKGKAPHRVMELLGELTVELGSQATREQALAMMRERAGKLGADAVIDVVVESVKEEHPASLFSVVPQAVMGTLVSLLTLNPQAMGDATEAATRPIFVRTVKVVRGMAVKFPR